MNSQPPETQIKVLSGRVDTLETRVTAHGNEIDELRAQSIRYEERDRYRDEQMRELVSKMDRIDGKLDLMAAKPAEKWDKAAWIVVSVVITAVVTSALSRFFGI